HRAVATGVLPSRVGMENEHQGAGFVHGAKVHLLGKGTLESPPVGGNQFPSIQSQSLGGQTLGLFLGIPGVDSTNLGRPLSSGIPIQFLQIVKPGELYGDRLTSIDLRFGKILRFGNSRTAINFDVYNLFNENTT